jgi:hypothetical protein
VIVRTDDNIGRLTDSQNGMTVITPEPGIAFRVRVREVGGSNPLSPTQLYHQAYQWSPRIAIRGLPCYLRYTHFILRNSHVLPAPGALVFTDGSVRSNV